jgi:hypothetical protein
MPSSFAFNQLLPAPSSMVALALVTGPFSQRFPPQATPACEIERDLDGPKFEAAQENQLFPAGIATMP